MNPQQHQVRGWMDARDRIVRYTPVTNIPVAERFDQVQRLIDATWSLAHDLGISLGAQPVAVGTGQDAHSPAVILARLTELYVETLAAYHMVGLGPALSGGVWKYTERGQHQPPINWHELIDKTYLLKQEDMLFTD